MTALFMVRLTIQYHSGTTLVYPVRFAGWWREAPTKSCSGQNLSHLSSRGVSFPVPIGSQRCPLGAVRNKNQRISAFKKQDSCLQDCAPNFWSVILPENGTYRVVAQVTGPCDGSTDGHVYLQANGISLASGQVVPKGLSYGVTPTNDHRHASSFLSTNLSGYRCYPCSRPCDHLDVHLHNTVMS